MTINLNVSPYYDDYNEDKNYYRILFKPGFAVQARELTQLQTILQKQIEKFGNHVFTKGTRVTGGQTFIDDDVRYVKLAPTYSNNEIDVTQYDDLFLKGRDSGLKGKIVRSETTDGADPDTVWVKFLTSNTPSYLYANNEVVDVTNGNGVIQYTAQTVSSSASGFTTFFSVDEGVFFITDTFIRTQKQELPVSKYDPNANVIIGFKLNQEFIDSDEDTSLLDPSIGSPNYTAPGADRLQKKLTLKTKPFTSETANNVTESDFIEVARFADGKLLQLYPIPGYSPLDTKFARRTYNESGNYTVDKFIIRPNLANNSHLSFKISPGLAYVRGFEIEKISPTILNVQRATDTESVTGFDVSTFYGNYVEIDAPEGRLFNVNNHELVTLHNTNNISTLSSSSVIGTARIRQIQYASGSGSSQKFNAYLFKINMSGDNSFANTLSIAANTATNTFTAKAVVSNNVLQDTQYNTGVFEIPQEYIETIDSASYSTRDIFQSVSFTNGIGSITTGGSNERFKGASGGDVPDSLVNEYYSVVINTGGGGTTSFVNGEFVPLDTVSRSVTIPTVSSGSPGTAEIDINDSNFQGTADVYATIDVTDDTPRTKILANNQISYSGVSPNTSYSLGQTDIYQINAVYHSANSARAANTSDEDIKSSFILDTGQRDNYYDFGSIRLNPTASTPNGQILVAFQNFEHAGGRGFFSVDSYNIAYANTPTFTSERTGDLYQLRDTLDFRPIRSESSNTEYVFNTHRYPIAFNYIDSDFSYYLPRKDRIVLKENGNFEYIKGVSNFTNPRIPDAPERSMSIATIDLEPFGVTLKQKDVKINHIDNRRYTMRDIGNIDKRVTRVEYYTSLSLLEREIESRKVLDSQGLDVFKNGIVVDSFSGHGIGDVKNRDYKISVDQTNKYARPPFRLRDYNLAVNSGNTTATIGKTQVTIPYSEVNFITQPLASKTIAINPFNVSQWEGTLKIDPDNDTWYAYESRPDVIINNNGDQDAWESGENFDGAYFNAWENIWSGEELTDTEIIKSIQESNEATRDTQDIRLKKTTDNIYSNLFGSNKETVEERIVSKDVIPYIRQKSIKWDVEGLRPNTELHLFFDDVLLDSYFIQSGKTSLDVVKTDETGAANGYFYIPNDPDRGFVFTTGEKDVVITDTALDYRLTRTKAETIYKATGIYKRKPRSRTRSRSNRTKDTSSPGDYYDVDGHFDSGPNNLGPSKPGEAVSESTLKAINESESNEATRQEDYIDLDNNSKKQSYDEAVKDSNVNSAAQSAGADDYEDLVQQIDNAYKTFLGRKPDYEGSQFYVDEAINRGTSLDQIKAEIRNSPEARGN